MSVSVQDAACPGITHKNDLSGLSWQSPHPTVLADALLCFQVACLSNTTDKHKLKVTVVFERLVYTFCLMKIDNKVRTSHLQSARFFDFLLRTVVSMSLIFGPIIMTSILT